jgi:hypothetical protein
MQVVLAISNLNKFPRDEFIKIRAYVIDRKKTGNSGGWRAYAPHARLFSGGYSIESDLDLPKVRQVQILSIARAKAFTSKPNRQLKNTGRRGRYSKASVIYYNFQQTCPTKPASAYLPEHTCLSIPVSAYLPGKQDLPE